MRPRAVSALSFSLAATVAWTGCTTDATPLPDATNRDAATGDAGRDGGRPDASRDASAPVDAAFDAAASDAALDGSAVDADITDADALLDASSDAGPFDSGLPCPELRLPVASPGDDIGGDTYVTFAAGFFATYCTGCHSSTLVTDVERMGAPPGLDWDVESVVRGDLFRIRWDVGEGQRMPPMEPLPTCEERFRLVRWIDADAP